MQMKWEDAYHSLELSLFEIIQNIDTNSKLKYIKILINIELSIMVCGKS